MRRTIPGLIAAAVLLGVSGCGTQPATEAARPGETPVATHSAPTYDTAWHVATPTITSSARNVLGRTAAEGAAAAATRLITEWMANPAVVDFRDHYSIHDFDGLRRLMGASAWADFRRSFAGSERNYDPNSKDTVNVHSLALYHVVGRDVMAKTGPMMVHQRLRKVVVREIRGRAVVDTTASVAFRMIDTRHHRHAPSYYTITRRNRFWMGNVGGRWKMDGWWGNVDSAPITPRHDA